MSILPQANQFLQAEVLPFISSKWIPRFTLGVNALSLTPFDSFNANARLARDNPQASMQQMYRLCRHEKLMDVFANILINLFSITDESVIIIDFSSLHPFNILCFAIQTRDGRGIPVWIDVIEHPIEDETSQNIFILDALREFLAVIGCTPKIVCDRGFIGETLIHGFLDLGLTFYVRMKAGKHVFIDSKKKSLSKLWKLEAKAKIYDEPLRVVRSSKTLQRKLKAKECWYIITNDILTLREEIINIYYYRFEIEESFKDLKHILKTKANFIKKTQSIKMLLWFQILGFWILFKLDRLTESIKKRALLSKHKARSWFRYSFEKLQQERLAPLIHYPTSRKEVSAA